MKVIVTGASGFIGASLLKDCLKAGHEAICLKRPNSDLRRVAGESFRTIDFTDDAGSLAPEDEAALAAAAPDAMIHLAWRGVGNQDRNDLMQIENIALTTGLARLAARLGARRFIGLGSQAEYGPCAGRIAEDQPLAPTTLYGATKASAYLLSKTLCEQAGVAFSWIRVFSTYGPDDEPYWMIPSLIRSLSSQGYYAMTPGEQRWDYCHVRDAARAVRLVSELEEGAGAVNLGSGASAPIRFFAEKIRDLVNPAATLGFGDISYRPDQVMRLEADTDKLTRLTGWRPEVALEDGLRETVDWYLQKGGGGHG